MGKHDAPHRIEVTEEELLSLESRLINGDKLSDRDVKIILNFMKIVTWMNDRLSRAKLTIKRLQKFFGFESEKKSSKKKSNDDASEVSLDSISENTSSTNEDTTNNTKGDDTCADSASEKAGLKQPVWNPDANHGRQGVDKYTGCPLIDVPFEDEHLKKGLCPDCAKANTAAKVYPETPSVLIFLKSQPLVSGLRYQLSKARCSICNKRFVATLPDELKNQPKYDRSCISAIAIHHYYAGFPFKRMEMLQLAQGVPLSDATQFDLVSDFYKKTLKPIFFELIKCAAQGNKLLFDDTPHRVLSQLSLNNQLNDKHGKQSVHSTAIISEYNGHRIYLFRTNTQTAGSELEDLLNLRRVICVFITMSDASASNFHYLNDVLLSHWVISLCLAHARRRFIDLEDDDANFVVEIFSMIYHHDAQAKKLSLTPEERLIYHQEKSGPLMESLKVWLSNLLNKKIVEPNSVFGQAITYLLKHFHWFTQFLRIPGVCLDNNFCEQAIKLIILYRKNSYFYRNFYGANVGDAIISLLHTAFFCGVNIFDYFNALQLYSDKVNENPSAWLPWCYKESIKQLSSEVEIDCKVINSS